MLNYQRVHNLLGCTLLIISHSFCGKMTWDFHKLAQNLHQCSFTEVLKGRQSWPGMSKSGSGRWCRGIPLKIPLDSPSCESWLNCWDGTGSNWGSSPKIPSSQWKWPRKIRKRASLPGFLSKTLTWLTPNWPKPFPDSNSKYIWIYIYITIYIYRGLFPGTRFVGLMWTPLFLASRCVKPWGVIRSPRATSDDKRGRNDQCGRWKSRNIHCTAVLRRGVMWYTGMMSLKIGCNNGKRSIVAKFCYRLGTGLWYTEIVKFSKLGIVHRSIWSHWLIHQKSPTVTRSLAMTLHLW